jgi:hypothetical protein
LGLIQTLQVWQKFMYRNTQGSLVAFASAKLRREKPTPGWIISIPLGLGNQMTTTHQDCLVFLRKQRETKFSDAD